MKTKEVIIGFIKKYSIESVAVLAFSIMAAVVFDTYETKPLVLFEVIAIFAFVAVGTFLVDKIFIVYENEIRQKVGTKETSFKVARQISYTVVFALEYLLCMWMVYLMNHALISLRGATFSPYDRYDQIHTLVVAAAIVLEVVLPIVIYLVIKEKRLSLKEYMLKLFMNSIFVFVICCVVLAGILVLYLICEVLLGTIPYYIISRIIMFILSMISFMGLFVSIENVDGRQSLFSKILVRYIMQIMVFIGFVIFYIYLVKIIVKLELPSNQVFVVCTTLFSIGLATSLMSLGVNEESKYSTAIKFLPVAFIPALILQIISLGLRIGQHGLTQNRYVGVIVIIFEIVYLVFYIRYEILKKEKVKLEKVLLVASLLILISCFVPKINMHELPGICNKIFNVKEIERVEDNYDQESNN